MDPINKPRPDTAAGAVKDAGDRRDGFQQREATNSFPEPARMARADARHGPPTASSPPNASEVTSSDLQGTEDTSPHYNVGFYNKTPDSTGHEHHVRQGEVELMAPGTDEAIAGAIAEFEADEAVSTWRDRASAIECVQTRGEG